MPVALTVNFTVSPTFAETDWGCCVTAKGATTFTETADELILLPLPSVTEHLTLMPFQPSVNFTEAVAAVCPDHIVQSDAEDFL